MRAPAASSLSSSKSSPTPETPRGVDRFRRSRVASRVKLALVFMVSLSGLPRASVASPVASAATTGAKAVYPLDSMARETSPRGRLRCPDLPMVRHVGEHVRYHKPVKVYVGFRESLVRFEKIVEATALEVYGRKPARIRHIGTFNCRRIRKFPDWLSEHALGNAIDVEGFDFGRASKAERTRAPHPTLRGAFQVRVEKHWNKRGAVPEIHARFLRRLTERLQEDKVFRVLLGPAYPGHHDHFHFDMAPYEMVEL